MSTQVQESLFIHFDPCGQRFLDGIPQAFSFSQTVVFTLPLVFIGAILALFFFVVVFGGSVFVFCLFSNSPTCLRIDSAALKRVGREKPLLSGGCRSWTLSSPSLQVFMRPFDLFCSSRMELIFN